MTLNAQSSHCRISWRKGQKAFQNPIFGVTFQLVQKLPQIQQAIQCEMNLVNSLIEVESASKIEFLFIIVISFSLLTGEYGRRSLPRVQGRLVIFWRKLCTALLLIGTISFTTYVMDAFLQLSICFDFQQNWPLQTILEFLPNPLRKISVFRFGFGFSLKYFAISLIFWLHFAFENIMPWQKAPKT
jgi:hypothetical protein